MNFQNELIKLNACEEAVIWVNSKTKEQAWAMCPRGDWMIWLLKSDNLVDLRTLTKCKVECAKLVLHLMKDDRSKNALLVAEKFANGNATREELDAAAAYATAATYAAYATAVDAYADAVTDAVTAAYATAATYAAYAAGAAAYAYATADAADADDAVTATYAADADALDAYAAAVTAATADAAADAADAARTNTLLKCANIIRDIVPVI